jgi:predicted thioesterase
VFPRPGLTATTGLVVGVADTAAALGSGDVHVLGTPRVLALCEAATVAAVAGHLDPELTSVGTRVEVDHRRPARPGAFVQATAVLREVAGRRLVFDVAVTEPDGPVASAVIVRTVVPRARFDGSAGSQASTDERG